MLWLSKQQKQKLDQQKELELQKYKQRIIELSDKLVDWCKKEEMTMADFETLIEATRNRFKLIFGKTKIEALKGKIK